MKCVYIQLEIRNKTQDTYLNNEHNRPFQLLIF